MLLLIHRLNKQRHSKMATTDEYVKYDIRFFNEFYKYLNFDEEDLLGLEKAVNIGLLQRDRLVELATSKVGKIAMDSTSGQDLADTSDVKTVVSGIRNNNIGKGQWMHSFPVRKVASKNGPLRVIAYNKIADKFHYFFIPFSAYQHCKHTVEIVVEQVSGQFSKPNFNGMPKTTRQWWQYEVDSFEDLCKIKPGGKRTRKKLSTFDKFFM